MSDRKLNPEALGDLYETLSGTVAFVSIMHGKGPDAIVPDTVDCPLGVPIKLGAMVADAQAALAKAQAA